MVKSEKELERAVSIVMEKKTIEGWKKDRVSLFYQ